MMKNRSLWLTTWVVACFSAGGISLAFCQETPSQNDSPDAELQKAYSQTIYKVAIKVGYLRFQNGDTAYLNEQLQIEPDLTAKLQTLIRDFDDAKRTIDKQPLNDQAEILSRFKQVADLSLDLDKSIDEVLNKKQARRLNQIAIQTFFRQYHEDRTGLATPILHLNQMNVEQEVISKVKKVYDDEFADYCVERKELRDEKLWEILDALPKETRKKFDELIGKPVDWNDPAK